MSLGLLKLSLIYGSRASIQSTECFALLHPEFPLGHTVSGQLQWLMVRSLQNWDDGQHHSHPHSHLVINSTKVWEAFHDQIVLLCQEVLFLSQIRIPLICYSCAIFGQATVDDLKFSGLSALLVYYDPGNVFPDCFFPHLRVSLLAQMVKNLSAILETWIRSLDWKDPLEEETGTHSRILAWRIPWTEEPGRLWSMGSPHQSVMIQEMFSLVDSFYIQSCSITILYRVIYRNNCLKIFNHHQFCQKPGYTLSSARDNNLIK